MSAFALTLVLLAAFLHASWNAMVKANGDRAVVIGAIAFMNFAVGSVLAAGAPLPAPESWPFIVASTLIHFLYYVLIFVAYRWGDLSQVYPVSRGIAPALVALGAFLTVGETLSPSGWAGLGLVSLGILLLATGRRAAGSDPRALAAALATGLVIASYSVVDGIGVRLSQAPLGYIGWLFVFELPVALFVLARRRASLPPGVPWIGLLGGLFSATAYGVVIYAKTVAPLGAVSAVRESSVIIAALIGVFLFGERPALKRVLSGLVVAAGVVLLVV